MTNQLLALLLIPIALTACGQASMDDGTAGNRDNRDLVQENVGTGSGNTSLKIVADDSAGTLNAAENNEYTLTINVPAGVRNVPVTVTVEPQFEVAFVANGVSFDNFTNTSSESLEYTTEFILPIEEANILASSQVDNSRALYTVSFIYDEEALEELLDEEEDVSTSNNNTGPLVTFQPTTEGEVIIASAEGNRYELTIGALDTSFSLNVSVAQGVSADFILYGESFHTVTNPSGGRQSSAITFNANRIRILRAKGKIVARSSIDQRVQTIHLNINREIGVQPISLADDIFPVEDVNNKYAMNTLGYDGDRIIVGLPLDNGDHNSTVEAPNTNMLYSGAARIYVRSSDGWELESHIKPNLDTIGVGDSLGWSVAISGDLAFVGVPGEDSNLFGEYAKDDFPSIANNNGVSNSGMVHVYKRNAANEWELYYYIKLPNGNMSNFGQNLAVSENADGSLTLAVSATNLNFGARNNEASYRTSVNNDSHSGRVIIYRIAETDDGYSFTRQQNIASPSGQVVDAGFGLQIAISEKYLVVSEPFRDFVIGNQEGTNLTHNRKGAVYAFARGNSTQEYGRKKEITRHLTRDDRVFTLAIGSALAVDDNLIYVGSPNYTEVAESTRVRTGAVYVFHTKNNGSSWRLLRKVLSDNPKSYDLFGASIAVANKRLIVGSPGDNGVEGSAFGNYINNTETGTGAIFIYGYDETGAFRAFEYFQSQNIFDERLPNYGRNIQAYGDSVVVYSGTGFYFTE